MTSGPDQYQAFMDKRKLQHLVSFKEKAANKK